MELCEKCGVDEALQQRIEGCLTEVSGLRTSKVVQLLEAVVAAILETEPVLVAIDKTKNSKATYCAHMRTHGKGIAKMQRALHDMGEQVISDFPDIETSRGTRLLARTRSRSGARLRRRESSARPLASPKKHMCIAGPARGHVIIIRHCTWA